MFQPGRLEIRNITLEHIVASAYGLASFRLLDRLIVGWPETGIKGKRFDITATFLNSAGTVPKKEQQQRLVAEVLTSRFGFKAHRESRSLDGYRLVLAQPGVLGPRLRRVDFNCAVLTAEEIPRDPEGRSLCGASRWRPDGAFLRGSGDINRLVDRLNSFVNSAKERRLIVDETGLTGFFVWEFDYLGRRGNALGAAQDQLGLRLEPARVSVPIVVIDDVQMPTPN